MKGKSGWLVIFLVVFVWLTALFSMYAKDSFYDKAFEEAGVLGKLGNETVHSFHPAILSFLSTHRFDYNLPPFLEEQLSESEKSHLIDVKHILDVLQVLYYLALGLSLAWVGWLLKKKQFKILAEAMEYAGSICMGLLALAFVGSFFFSSFFMVFHWIFFPMGNYAFPATSLLIQLYPEGLFLKGFEIILGMVLMQSIILLMFGYLLKKDG